MGVIYASDTSGKIKALLKWLLFPHLQGGKHGTAN